MTCLHKVVKLTFIAFIRPSILHLQLLLWLKIYSVGFPPREQSMSGYKVTASVLCCTKEAGIYFTVITEWTSAAHSH